MKPIPRIIFTTDVNGTTTPDNTFAELVRPDNMHEQMSQLMESYTTGLCKFSDVLPEMEKLARYVDRLRLESYAKQMPLFHGVEETLRQLTDTRFFEAKVTLSTTGFAGLMVLLNKFRHGLRLRVAASPVFLNFLSGQERKCLMGAITEENDKTRVMDELISTHVPEPGMIFHVGDTMGDFPALVHTAKKGGTGIAFCPNESLKTRIHAIDPAIKKRIAIVNPIPGKGPDYFEVFRIVQNKIRKSNPLLHP